MIHDVSTAENVDTILNIAQAVSLLGEIAGHVEFSSVDIQLNATVEHGRELLGAGFEVHRYATVEDRSGDVRLEFGRVQLYAPMTGPELDELEAVKVALRLLTPS